MANTKGLSTFSKKGIGIGAPGIQFTPHADAPTDSKVSAGRGYFTTGDKFYIRNNADDGYIDVTAGGGTSDSFKTIDCPAGNDPVADSSTDTLILTAGTGLTITGTAGTDTIAFALSLGAIDHDSLLNFVAGEHFTMLDEDNMTSDSNTQAATQQSIKAYVDTYRLGALADTLLWIGDGSGDSQPRVLGGDGLLANDGTLSISDLTISGEAQGDVLYFDGSGWESLPAGVSGKFLKTQGAGSNPIWDTPNIATATDIANLCTLNDAGANDAILSFTQQTTSAPTLTIPDFAGVDDEFVFKTKAVTLANKTLTLPTIADFTNATHTHNDNANGGASLGAITATTVNKLTLTQPATGSTITVLDGKTLTCNHSITLAGTDAQTYTFPASSDTVACLGTIQTLTANQTIEYGHLLLGDSDDGQTLQILVNENMTGDHTLTILPNDGNRSISLTGNLTLANNFTTTGDFTTSLTQSANVTLALPGANTTLVGHDTTNTLTNKSLDCDGTGNALTNVNADELDSVTPGVGIYGAHFVIAQPLTNLPAAGTNIFVDNAPFKFRVIKVWSVATTANGGTWALHKGKIGALGNAITNTVTVASVDTDIDEATKIDDTEHEIAGSGSLVAVGDGGGALDVILYVECMKVD